MSGAGWQILVVEADQATGRRLEEILKLGFPGSRITRTTSVSQASEILASTPPGLALVDLTLPGGNSLDLFTFPPEDGPCPMIALSRDGRECSALTPFKAGALDFLVLNDATLEALPGTVEQVMEEWKTLQICAQLHDGRSDDRNLPLLPTAPVCRHAMQAYRRNEERWHTYMQKSPMAIFLGDMTGRLIDVNPAACEMTGHTREDLLGGRADLFPDPKAQELVRRHRQQAQQTGTAEGEYPFLREDGSQRLVRANSVRIEEGRYLTLCHDVTERRRSEEHLRVLAELLDVTPASITVHDLEGNFLYVNRRTLQYHGYSLEDFLRVNLHDIDDPESSRLIRPRIQSMMENGEGSFEVSHFRRDGSVLPLLVTGRVTSWEGRDVVLSVAQDLTERKEAEKRLLASKAELEETNRRLEEAVSAARELARQAQAASLAKSEFVANVSHELRTPLNGIIGMTGVLLDGDLGPGMRDHVSVVRECGESLLRLVNDILDFSKVESGKLALEEIPFDLRTTLADTLETVKSRAESKGLSLTRTIDAEAPSLLIGDPGRLRQILLNLLGNAIKFTHRGSVEVEVRLERENQETVRLLFRVKDTGIGIPEEKLAAIFEPFTQVDGSTTREYGGTGLGLAISRQLVEALDGSMGVESVPGEGSLFWFTAGFRRQAEAQDDAPVEMTSLKGKRILVVQPGRPEREELIEVLQESGCRIFDAEEATQAVRILRQALQKGAPVDAVLIASELPGMGGVGLARRIKEDRDFDGTRLLLLASKGRRGDAALARSVGFAGYLTEPMEPARIRDCLAMAMAGSFDQDNAAPMITRHSLSDAARRQAHDPLEDLL